MLIAARNAFMTRLLPYDAEVEYLESTGTQYIDTGVFLSSNHMVSLRSLQTGNNSMFGSVIGNQYFFGGQTGGGSTYAANFGTTFARVEGTRIRNVYTITVSKDGLVVDGVGAAHTLSGNFSCTATCGAFCRNAQSEGFLANDTAASGSRLYWLSILDGAVLVRDFIPVRVGTTGYLYDRVSGKLFGNQGTGDFVIGPDVVPVEYLESHGTEYIDTEVKLRSTDTIDTRFYINSSTTSAWYGVLGARDAERYLCVRCFNSNDGLVNVSQPDKNFTFNRFTWGNLLFTFGGNYYETTHNCYLFTYNNIGSKAGCLPYRFANFSITRDSSKIINLLPVRVGTDATSWEGAMMDVLTRRIYRNAGTGAFTYGNDLRYPIPME